MISALSSNSASNFACISSLVIELSISMVFVVACGVSPSPSANTTSPASDVTESSIAETSSDAEILPSERIVIMTKVAISNIFLFIKFPHFCLIIVIILQNNI